MGDLVQRLREKAARMQKLFPLIAGRRRALDKYPLLADDVSKLKKAMSNFEETLSAGADALEAAERERISLSAWKDSARVNKARADEAEAALVEAREVVRGLMYHIPSWFEDDDKHERAVSAKERARTWLDQHGGGDE